MSKKESPKFPKGFFKQHRPEISMKEALKDVVPVKWSKEILESNKKVVIEKKNQSNI